MKNSTGIPALDRLIRSLLQFIVSAGFTAAVTSLSGGLSSNVKVIVLAVSQLVVIGSQNVLEDMGTIPPILKGSSEAEYAQQLGLKQ